MRLDKYMKDKCVNKNEFSKKLGVSYPTLANIVAGKGDIHLATAVRIEELTEGKVTCKDLVNPLAIKNLELKAQFLQKK